MKQVCDVLGVARSAVVPRHKRPADWRDGHRERLMNYVELIDETRSLITGLPRYGYRRVWAQVRRRREEQGAAPVNVKRIYRVMRDLALLLERRSTQSQSWRHDGTIAVEQRDVRWCSDGFEFRRDASSPLRVTFVLDCWSGRP